jgi:hypothetical protein
MSQRARAGRVDGPGQDTATLDPSTVSISRGPAGRCFAVLHVDVLDRDPPYRTCVL